MAKNTGCHGDYSKYDQMERPEAEERKRDSKVLLDAEAFAFSQIKWQVGDERQDWWESWKRRCWPLVLKNTEWGYLTVVISIKPWEHEELGGEAG